MRSIEHWERIHAEKHTDVSWWQEADALWLDLIERTEVDKDQAVIDVGGGASLLVDALVHNGYTDVTLLDIAQSALDRVKQRLGTAVSYVASDVTKYENDKKFALWHDRAVFHFLTSEGAKAAYRESVKAHTVKGSWVVLCTFADDGPDKCSGLDVQRYSEEQLSRALGPDFTCHWTLRRSHMTPWNSEQKFVIAAFTRN